MLKRYLINKFELVQGCCVVRPEDILRRRRVVRAERQRSVCAVGRPEALQVHAPAAVVHAVVQCSVERVLPQPGERLLGDLRPGEQGIFAAARPPHDEAAAAGCVSEANGRELPLRSGQAAVSRRLYLRFGSEHSNIIM